MRDCLCVINVVRILFRDYNLVDIREFLVIVWFVYKGNLKKKI